MLEQRVFGENAPAFGEHGKHDRQNQPGGTAVRSNRRYNPNFTGNAGLGTSVVESREAIEARILISGNTFAHGN